VERRGRGGRLDSDRPRSPIRPCSLRAVATTAFRSLLRTNSSPRRICLGASQPNLRSSAERRRGPQPGDRAIGASEWGDGRIREHGTLNARQCRPIDDEGRIRLTFFQNCTSDYKPRSLPLLRFVMHKATLFHRLSQSHQPRKRGQKRPRAMKRLPTCSSLPGVRTTGSISSKR
jgi:hypothetical protein